MIKKLWLCLPFAVLSIIDFGLTLAGQPVPYWQGYHNRINEIFPLFAWALRNGPLIFLYTVLLWIFVFSVLILVLPNVFSQILSLALVIGHTFGATTWLAFRFRLNYHLCILFFIWSAVVFILAQEKWKKSKTSSRQFKH